MPLKPEQKKREYEKIKTGEFVIGVIDEIQHEEKRVFKFNGEEKSGPAVRFKFQIEGCEYPHYSRWMGLSYAPKATLFIKYLSKLVRGAQPYMDFDLMALKGIKLKMLWMDNGDFQNLETIMPVGLPIEPVKDMGEVVPF